MLPGMTQEKVLVCMFDNKYQLVNFHSSDINRNRMTDDGKVQSFKNSLGHHVDFRSIVHEGFNFDLLVDGCFGVARRTCVKCTVDLSRVDRSGSFGK